MAPKRRSCGRGNRYSKTPGYGLYGLHLYGLHTQKEPGAGFFFLDRDSVWSGLSLRQPMLNSNGPDFETLASHSGTIDQTFKSNVRQICSRNSSGE